MGRKRQADEAQILGRLCPLAKAVESADELPEAIVVRASFLVETAKLGDFEAALAEVSRDFEGRGHVKSVGPLPPYSFVDVQLPAPPEGA